MMSPLLQRAYSATASRAAGSSLAAAVASEQRQHQQGRQQQQGWGGLLGAGAAAAAALALAGKDPADQCGIVGVVGGEDARSILIEGLTVLQNRGYDSAGMATISAERQVGALVSMSRVGSRPSR